MGGIGSAATVAEMAHVLFMVGIFFVLMVWVVELVVIAAVTLALIEGEVGLVVPPPPLLLLLLMVGARGGEVDSRSAWLRIKCLPLTLVCGRTICVNTHSRYEYLSEYCIRT